MEMVSLFDWLRWVEVPVWIGMFGWLFAHAKHDHAVEVQLAEAIGVIKTLETNMTILIQSLLERNPNG